MNDVDSASREPAKKILLWEPAMDQPKQQFPARGKKGFVRTAIAVLIIAGLIAATLLLPVKTYLAEALEWTAGLGSWGPIFVAVFYVAATVLFLPGSILTLGAGFLFGIFTGLVTVWIGATLGACAAFLVGRTVARDWVSSKISGKENFTAVDDAVGKEGFKIVFLMRLSPIFPFNFLNYALGLTKIKFRDYAVASAIGMIPAEFMYVYLGSAARSLADAAAGNIEQTSAATVFFWFGLAAAVAVTSYVTRLAGKSLKAVAASRKRMPDHSMPDHELTHPQMAPDDVYNGKLVSNVRPKEWRNPVPADKPYHIVVIGAGTAGLVTAAGAAGLGAKVALVEKFAMGGDCLNFGCVPSKSLIASARVASAIRSAARYGMQSSEPDVDFPAVMERLRRLRSEISGHDSAQRFSGLGVDVFFGNAAFIGRQEIEVNGQVIRFKKAVIATGARAAQPKIKGLHEAGFLTNETVFSLVKKPERLAVIGGGPIGCEMAQAFQRLGSQVVLFHKNDHILDREDPDAAEIIQQRFMKEGIRLILNSDILEVEKSENSKIVSFRTGQTKDSVAVDEVLVGVGRVPNTENLGLHEAGVDFDATGVTVDDRLQTSNPNIYAAGDICSKYKFTHAADAAARIVIQNALFLGRRKCSGLTIPWCTYTDPEIAHVGMYESEANASGVELNTFFVPFGDVDRAVVEGSEEGFAKVHVKKGTDEIVGATIVGSHAGDIINQLTFCIGRKIGLRALGEMIFPYPTQSEALKRAADAYNRTRLTPFVRRAMSYWFKLIGG